MGYDLITPDELFYFRLNIHTMAGYRTAMLDLGMAYEVAEEPDWPERPRDGRIALIAEALMEETDLPELALDAEIAEAKAYVEQADRVRRAHPAGSRIATTGQAG